MAFGLGMYWIGFFGGGSLETTVVEAQEQREPVTTTHLPSEVGQIVDIYIAQYSEQYPNFVLSLGIPDEGRACLHTRRDVHCFDAVNLESVHVDPAYFAHAEEFISVRVRRDVELSTDGMLQILNAVGASEDLSVDMVLSLLGRDVTDSVQSVVQAADENCVVSLETQLITC